MLELEVVHQTRYDYAAPVSLAHHLAHLQPLHDAHQRLQSFELLIDPPPAHISQSLDADGNVQHHFSLSQAHRKLLVTARSRITLSPRFDGLRAEATDPWDTLAQSLRYVAGAIYESAVQWTLPSPFVPRLGDLRDFAVDVFEPGRPVAEVAIELMQRLHGSMVYESKSTDVDTPLQQVLQTRRGVCQDFAHLMIGMLRMWGVPARYVSGYLLTRAPQDGSAMLGADASHAWVQVWCPPPSADLPLDRDTPAANSGFWLDLDPTNKLIPSNGHVRVAVGRDFGDVTPLRGVIQGGGEHKLHVAVSTQMPAAPQTHPQTHRQTHPQTQTQPLTRTAFDEPTQLVTPGPASARNANC